MPFIYELALAELLLLPTLSWLPLLMVATSFTKNLQRRKCSYCEDENGKNKLLNYNTIAPRNKKTLLGDKLCFSNITYILPAVEKKDRAIASGSI